MGRRPPPPAPDSGHHEVASDRGCKAAVIADTLIECDKLNGVDPQARLTDVLSRIADREMTRMDELLLWRHAAAAP